MQKPDSNYGFRNAGDAQAGVTARSGANSGFAVKPHRKLLCLDTARTTAAGRPGSSRKWLGGAVRRGVAISLITLGSVLLRLAPRVRRTSRNNTRDREPTDAGRFVLVLGPGGL